MRQRTLWAFLYTVSHLMLGSCSDAPKTDPEAPQSQSESPLFVVEPPVTTTYEEARNQCSQIVSKLPWQDERTHPGGKDEAFNCRDHTAVFISCMQALGYPQHAGINIFCKKCDSQSSHGHRIVLTKNPGTGKWCPWEPQSEDGRKERYGDCCQADQSGAGKCANQKYCESKTDCGCKPKPEKFKILLPDECKEEKSCLFNPETGKLTCKVSDDGLHDWFSEVDAPLAPKVKKIPLSPCQDAVAKCFERHKDKGQRCGENGLCVRKKLWECKSAKQPEKTLPNTGRARPPRWRR